MYCMHIYTIVYTVCTYRKLYVTKCLIFIYKMLNILNFRESVAYRFYFKEFKYYIH